MRNPIWRLKTLPWVTLLQNAALTVVLATVLDVGLLLLLGALWQVWPSVENLVLENALVGSGLALLAAAGIGALAVVLMERLFRWVRLDGGTLWALVGCLALLLFIKSQLPIPSLLVGFSQPQIIALLVGLFTKGRSHWRW